MLDNTTKLLIGSWQKPWDICEGDNWNLESITEPDKACSFDGSIYVKTTS